MGFQYIPGTRVHCSILSPGATMTGPFSGIMFGVNSNPVTATSFHIRSWVILATREGPFGL